jgi:hypothetical protein
MTGKELQYVIDTVKQEGLDYAFESYSDYSEIKDKQFHKLRKAYTTAASELREFLGID